MAETERRSYLFASTAAVALSTPIGVSATRQKRPRDFRRKRGGGSTLKCPRSGSAVMQWKTFGAGRKGYYRHTASNSFSAATPSMLSRLRASAILGAL
jgi:hypothetical protein